MWDQVYDPLHSKALSTIAAALPVVTLLVLIASNKAKAHVVASTATNWFGHEGAILRFVFGHSIVLASLVGVLVMLQAYVFTGMIVQ